MFDTHETIYHLDADNNIVWLQCSKIADEIIWIQTSQQAIGYIGNPWVFAQSTDTSILEELTQTYSTRIGKWLQKNWTERDELSQAA
jgi:hypothetical protein